MPKHNGEHNGYCCSNFLFIFPLATRTRRCSSSKWVASSCDVNNYKMRLDRFVGSSCHSRSQYTRNTATCCLVISSMWWIIWGTERRVNNLYVNRAKSCEEAIHVRSVQVKHTYAQASVHTAWNSIFVLIKSIYLTHCRWANDRLPLNGRRRITSAVVSLKLNMKCFLLAAIMRKAGTKWWTSEMRKTLPSGKD